MEAIIAEHLTKSYGKARGIRDLNLKVPEGAFFGFIGPNGAGKSTTIRTLLGLIHATSGRAAVLGMDVERDKKKILQEVGYLPSEAIFYPEMRVGDVIRLSAALRKKDCSARAEELCSLLQLDREKRIEELSFGNRKKVGIVAALQHDPRLLVLDEPTSGLDPLMQHAFFEILRERNAKGMTILMSSHVLPEIRQNCTQAAIIRDGRIIACQTVEALSKTSAKRISLRGKPNLQGLTGVQDLRQNQGTTEFLYSGPMQPLLERLAGGMVEDITITEPDLEEIFLHYYGEGRESK